MSDWIVCVDCGTDRQEHSHKLCRQCWRRRQEYTKLCPDCDKPITRFSKRCKQCHVESRRDEWAAMRRVKRTHECIQCGVECSLVSIRCRKCFCGHRWPLRKTRLKEARKEAVKLFREYDSSFVQIHP